MPNSRYAWHISVYLLILQGNMCWKVGRPPSLPPTPSPHSTNPQKSCVPFTITKESLRISFNNSHELHCINNGFYGVHDFFSCVYYRCSAECIDITRLCRIRYLGMVAFLGNVEEGGRCCWYYKVTMMGGGGVGYLGIEWWWGKWSLMAVRML